MVLDHGFVHQRHPPLGFGQRQPALVQIGHQPRIGQRRVVLVDDPLQPIEHALMKDRADVAQLEERLRKHRVAVLFDERDQAFPAAGLGNRFEGAETQRLTVGQPRRQHHFGQSLQHRNHDIDDVRIVDVVVCRPRHRIDQRPDGRLEPGPKHTVELRHRSDADRVVLLHLPGDFDQSTGFGDQAPTRQPVQQVLEQSLTHPRRKDLYRIPAPGEGDVQQRPRQRGVDERREFSTDPVRIAGHQRTQ